MYILKNIPDNDISYFSAATECIAALLACLAIQKNSLRGRPLTHFFVTQIKQAELLYILFNYRIKDA